MNGLAKPPAASTDFDGTRLTVARRLRGKTKSALAREVDLTPTAIAQFEKGPANPSQAVLARICMALGMPREFFGAGHPLTLLPASDAHFRSLRSTSAVERERALAYGVLSLEIVQLIEDYVDLPATNLPHLGVPDVITTDAIDVAVAEVKAAWGVPSGPIGNMVQLLESHGILALRLPTRTDRKVDAFSTNAGHRPLVFLNPGSHDRARSRFDAAHELGHLILHPDTEPGSKIVEKQAHAFAAEFLMPAAEIGPLLPRRIDWPTFHELKRDWGVSLRALVFRAHTLGKLSQASYRRANQQLSMWGLPEPGELGRAESPQLLGKATDLLAAHDIDLDSILTARRIVADVTADILAAGSDDKPKVSFD